MTVQLPQILVGLANEAHESTRSGWIWLRLTEPGGGGAGNPFRHRLLSPCHVQSRDQQCVLTWELVRHAESCPLRQDLLNQKLHFNTYKFEQHCPRSRHLRLRAKKDIRHPTPQIQELHQSPGFYTWPRPFYREGIWDPSVTLTCQNPFSGQPDPQTQTHSPGSKQSCLLPTTLP